MTAGNNYHTHSYIDTYKSPVNCKHLLWLQDYYLGMLFCFFVDILCVFSHTFEVQGLVCLRTLGYSNRKYKLWILPVMIEVKASKVPSVDLSAIDLQTQHIQIWFNLTWIKTPQKIQFLKKLEHEWLVFVALLVTKSHHHFLKLSSIDFLMITSSELILVPSM